MQANISIGSVRQHLIDPEVCIHCNTCEATCTLAAIAHNDLNYVVNPDVCNGCMDCIPSCPTGAIDNWRTVPKGSEHSVEAQLSWGRLPTQEPVLVFEDGETAPMLLTKRVRDAADADDRAELLRPSALPPWSAAHPYVNLYTHKNTATATIVENRRLTTEASGADIRHIVLDLGGVPFPVLEGQSIGVFPPGETADGRPHHARQYSVSSPRDGEQTGKNWLALTVKRVAKEHDGNGLDGVCSNYLCDCVPGQSVTLIGPFGNTFLMPNHPDSHLLMVCTGTGAAPMRAMAEYRRRNRERTGKSRLMLFFGGRSRAELPYVDSFTDLPGDLIETHLALSREHGESKRYVQDAMRERACDVAQMLEDDDTYIYLCGVKGMEGGVLEALAEICAQSGIDWSFISQRMTRLGHLHIETY